jgi:hypothetical protein
MIHVYLASEAEIDRQCFNSRSPGVPPGPPLKDFLKKVLKNPKNFSNSFSSFKSYGKSASLL